MNIGPMPPSDDRASNERPLCTLYQKLGRTLSADFGTACINLTVRLLWYGTVHGREVRFRVYPHDHLPVHAHARIGAGEVVVEILARDGVRLSLAHGKSVIGDVKRNEVRKVLKEAAEITQAIRAEWRAMHK